MTGYCDCSGKHILDDQKAWNRRRVSMYRNVGLEDKIDGTALAHVD